MAESAAGHGAVVVDPFRGAFRDRQHFCVVGDVVERGQTADRPAVLARVKVLVDARHAKLAPLGVAKRVIFVAIGIVVQIGVLADIERAVGADQKAREIALDVARRGEIFLVLPERIGLAVLPQILRLKRHDLFEMRLAPASAFRILEHAAPHRIDQRGRGVEGLPRALGRDVVAGLGAGHRIVHAVGVDVFLVFAPAAEVVFVGFVDILDEFGALLLGQEDRCGRLDLKGFADRRAGRRIVDDGLEQGLHPRRLDIAADLGDLGAVGAEYDGRRPAPVAVAAGQIRVGVLVHPHRNIFRRQQFGDFGVGVGGLFHHMAPMAPHRFEIENHKALLGGRAGKQLVVPAVPLDGFVRE